GHAHVLTTSTGQQYGSFNGKLAQRHQQDRKQRRRRAQLWACLKPQLPSTRNRKLARHVRQEINRAVNDLSREHRDARCPSEQAHMAAMRLKSRRMHASLYGSQLAHIPAQLAWGAAKARHLGAHAHECLQLARVPARSPCCPPELSRPTDALW